MPMRLEASRCVHIGMTSRSSSGLSRQVTMSPAYGMESRRTAMSLLEVVVSDLVGQPSEARVHRRLDARARRWCAGRFRTVPPGPGRGRACPCTSNFQSYNPNRAPMATSSMPASMARCRAYSLQPKFALQRAGGMDGGVGLVVVGLLEHLVGPDARLLDLAEVRDRTWGPRSR